MEKPAHILVVIDPTATEQPALERARLLALAFQARVELFMCHQKEPSSSLRVDERVLERLANGLREQGIQTLTDECSAEAIHAGIVDKVQRSRPSLVVKQTHPHSVLRRSVLSNTDWQLIRTCPAPLLFVREGDWAHPPRIAAAVDTSIPGEKPATLDRSLLSAAESYALAMHGEMHAVHCYLPVSSSGAIATALTVPMAADVTPEQIIADNAARASERFDAALDGHPVPRERRHLLCGAPGDALLEFVRRQRIDVLVMGAISRGWVYNVLVGSTTERLLDFLPCDVLVVRPGRLEYADLQPLRPPAA